MKAVVLLTLIGLASCHITFVRDVDRDVEVKYKIDDDYDREVEVDFDDRPATILSPFVTPVVHRRPDTVHRFVQVSAAPAPQFRTSVVPVASPAVAHVVADTAPVQVVASHPQVFTQPREIVPVAPQAPVFVQERVVPVVSAPRADVVTQYVKAEPVVARTSFVTPEVSVPVVAASSVPVVTQPRATFVTGGRDIFRSTDDSSEK